MKPIETELRNLPDFINLRGDSYHRLNVRHGIHHLYGHKKRYLLVNKFGRICGEKTMVGLLNEILEEKRRGAS